MYVFVGCFTWNAIWCGEKVNLLLFVTFSSTVKKPRFSVYPTRSGKPKLAQDSTLVHVILGVFFLTFCQSLDSFFRVCYSTKIISLYFSYLGPISLFSISLISFILNSFCIKCNCIRKQCKLKGFSIVVDTIDRDQRQNVVVNVKTNVATGLFTHEVVNIGESTQCVQRRT